MDHRWYLFGLAMVLMGLTILSLLLIRSPHRPYQRLAYNFTQATNGIMLLISGLLFTLMTLGLMLHGGDGAGMIIWVITGPLTVFFGDGFIWLLRFNRQSVRIARYREEFNLRPKERWEVSPWGIFEAPMQVEDLEVDAGWDSGNTDRGAGGGNSGDDEGPRHP